LRVDGDERGGGNKRVAGVGVSAGSGSYKLHVILSVEPICMPTQPQTHTHTLDGGIGHVRQRDLLSLPNDGTLKHDINTNI
jgi:hypothetical protein